MTNPEEWTPERINDLYCNMKLAETDFLKQAQEVGPIVAVGLCTGNANAFRSKTADVSQLLVPSSGFELNQHVQRQLKLLAWYMSTGGRALPKVAAHCRDVLEKLKQTRRARDPAAAAADAAPNKPWGTVKLDKTCVACGVQKVYEGLEECVKAGPGAWRFAALWPLLLKLSQRASLLAHRRDVTQSNKEKMVGEMSEAIKRLVGVVGLYAYKFRISGYPEVCAIAPPPPAHRVRTKPSMMEAKRQAEDERKAIKEKSVSEQLEILVKEVADFKGLVADAVKVDLELRKPFCEIRARLRLAGAQTVSLLGCETRCVQGGLESALAVLALEKGLNVAGACLVIYDKSPLCRWVNMKSKKGLIDDEHPNTALGFEADWLFKTQTEAKGFAVRTGGGHSKYLVISDAVGPDEQSITAADVRELLTEEDEVNFWKEKFAKLPRIQAVELTTANFDRLPEQTHGSDVGLLCSPEAREDGDDEHVGTQEARDSLASCESESVPVLIELAQGAYGMAQTNLAQLARLILNQGDEIPMMVKEAELLYPVPQLSASGSTRTNDLHKMKLELCQGCDFKCYSSKEKGVSPLVPDAGAIASLASVASEGSDGVRPDDALEESLVPEAGSKDVPFCIKNVTSDRLLDHCRQLLKELNDELPDCDGQALRKSVPSGNSSVDKCMHEVGHTVRCMLLDGRWGTPWQHDNRENVAAAHKKRPPPGKRPPKSN